MQPNQTPRHQKIADWIRAQIQCGHVKPHEQIPSENELSRMFDVSRVTVRHALATLEMEDMIYRRQGLGSFAKEGPVYQRLNELADFREEMTRAGVHATSELLAFEPVHESPAHELLSIEPGKPVMKLERIRLGNAEPIAVDRTWLPMLYGQLLNPDMLQERTIFDILESDYEIPVTEGRYKFEAVNAGEHLARQLHVAPQTALLLVQRCAKTIGSKMVYVQHRYYRSDRMAYEIILERDQHLAAGRGLTFKGINAIVNNG